MLKKCMKGFSFWKNWLDTFCVIWRERERESAGGQPLTFSLHYGRLDSYMCVLPCSVCDLDVNKVYHTYIMFLGKSHIYLPVKFKIHEHHIFITYDNVKAIALVEGITIIILAIVAQNWGWNLANECYKVPRRTLRNVTISKPRLLNLMFWP